MSSLEGLLPGMRTSTRKALLGCTSATCVTASTGVGRCSLSNWACHQSRSVEVLTQQARVIDGLQPECGCLTVGLSAFRQAVLACKTFSK